MATKKATARELLANPEELFKELEYLGNFPYRSEEIDPERLVRGLELFDFVDEGWNGLRYADEDFVSVFQTYIDTKVKARDYSIGNRIDNKDQIGALTMLEVAGEEYKSRFDHSIVSDAGLDLLEKFAQLGNEDLDNALLRYFLRNPHCVKDVYAEERTILRMENIPMLRIATIVVREMDSLKMGFIKLDELSDETLVYGGHALALVLVERVRRAFDKQLLKAKTQEEIRELEERRYKQVYKADEELKVLVQRAKERLQGVSQD